MLQLNRTKDSIVQSSPVFQHSIPFSDSCVLYTSLPQLPFASSRPWPPESPRLFQTLFRYSAWGCSPSVFSSKLARSISAADLLSVGRLPFGWKKTVMGASTGMIQFMVNQMRNGAPRERPVLIPSGSTDKTNMFARAASAERRRWSSYL